MNASHLSFMSIGAYPMAIARISSREMTMLGSRPLFLRVKGLVLPATAGARRIQAIRNGQTLASWAQPGFRLNG